MNIHRWLSEHEDIMDELDEMERELNREGMRRNYWSAEDIEEAARRAGRDIDSFEAERIEDRLWDEQIKP